MAINAWLPIGYKLPDGAIARIAIFEGIDWQIIEVLSGGRALIAHDKLTQQWISSGLIDHDSLTAFYFGNQRFWSISCSASQNLCPVSKIRPPNTKNVALIFAQAFKATREITSGLSLQDALYIETLNRLLPTYSTGPNTDDDFILGYWLTGGVNISVRSFRQLCTLSAFSAADLKDIVETAGLHLDNNDLVLLKGIEASIQNEKAQQFELPGRPDLERFINEHIIHIIQNRERYKQLGIGFPSAVILHGPPGCGKTFAVEQLIDYLGWPSFHINASSIASPYIHETSKKVAEIFDMALKYAPSVLVIDEMEAFLSNRELGSGHHHVEEVAEFLRRIPEATTNDVLIVAMTNRVDMIDPAILRRGRFDHIIKVDYANEIEVLALLEKLLAPLPKEEDIDLIPISKELADRPLSDVVFVVREGARLTARSGKDRLSQENLLSALHSSPARVEEIY
ncbi:ATP-binding protein [Legionella qingyii]|uniref:ATP-binding protein n=1 Tax=Legionella qingyii TaxID=2184757 RepID=A0A317TWW7_9GAMM|nr:ATP-binding protein [Legionella qingyii]PWY53883.1 ATP-binding protein [Legionella qingyii]RUR24160.1 ATP-binding protein [Legionella qingyii]